jgi:hypothetical protein
MASRQPNAIRWSKSEIEELTSLAGDYPWSLVCLYYNQWAKRCGFPARSPSSMQNRLRRSGCSQSSIGHYISTTTIHELVHISDTTILRWCRRGLLKHYWQGKRLYIHRQSLKEMADHRSEFFAGLPYGDLFLLFESEQTAQRLSQMQRMIKPGTALPVRCIETGMRYSCATHAANAYHVTRTSIHWAVKKGHRAGGVHWERIA